LLLLRRAGIVRSMGPPVKTASCLGAIVLALAVLAGCGGDDGRAKRVKVGAVLSITGAAGSLGTAERHTVDALKDSLSHAGGARIKWIVEDDGSDPAKAVAAVNRLIRENHVDVLICCSTSSNTLAVQPTVDAAQRPAISLGDAAAIVEPAGKKKWFFKTPYNDRLTLDAATDDLRGRFLSPVAFLAADDAYGASGLKEFKALAGQKGIQVSGSEQFADTDKDITAQVTRLQRGKPDAYVIWGTPPAAAIAQRSVRDLGIDVPVYQSFGAANQVFLDLSGKAGEGTLIAGGQLLIARDLDGDNPLEKRIISFADRFKKETGSAPSPYAGYTYDAMVIIRDAARRAVESGAEGKALARRLRDEIEKTHNLVGVTGIYSYSPDDHAGLDKRSVAMIEVIDGKFRAPTH
jgi:branched-chain amino acid transport system substrate-binding protein